MISSSVTPSRRNGLDVMVQCFQNTLENPPAIGAVITVKHLGSNFDGKLKKPMFWRERKDVSWEQFSLLHVATASNQVCQYLTNLIHIKAFSNLVWTKKENHRTFFERLGKELQFNQLDDW